MALYNSLDLSDSEAKALLELKDILHDQNIEIQDYVLVKWLTAGKFNAVNAAGMLLDSLKWRENNELLSEAPKWTPPKHVSGHMSYKWVGEDHFGQPVIWLPLGQSDPRNLVENGYKGDVIKFCYKLLEELLSTIETFHMKSRWITQIVAVVDLAGLTFHKVSHYETSQLVLHLMREYEAHYPELFYKVFVINTPRVFSYIYYLAKPLISKHTMSHVHIMTSNQSKWKPVLLEHLPLEVIPSDYGGEGPKYFEDSQD